jgi:signal transduction histidine kinase
MAHQPEEFIEKVEKVTEKQRASGPMDYEFEPETRLAPNKEHFDNLMTSQTPVDTADVRKVSSAKNSLVEEVANVDRIANRAQRTPQDLIAQSQEVMGKIDQLKQKLSTPNLELKSSIQQELRNKLSHIDDNLRVAMSRSGIEYTPPPPPEKSHNVIERFLGLLTDSQDKLQNLTTDIARVDASNKPFSPATMIVLQMKVGMMQQEIEFFTTVLNKALESTKTIMNVQV